MTNSIISIRKIKTNKVGKFTAWLYKINTDLQAEARETLKNENCALEFFYIIKIKKEYYAIGYMHFLEGGYKKKQLKELSVLDIKHKKILEECLSSKKESIRFGYEIMNYLLAR